MLARLTTQRLPHFFRDFDDFFRDFGVARPEGDQPHSIVPTADVIETDKAVEIRLDMPGLNPQDIDVTLEGENLTVTAERKTEKTEEKSGFLRQERSFGRYLRSFTLPDTLDGAQPEATYRNGVLTLVLPRKPEAQPRSVKVKVA